MKKIKVEMELCDALDYLAFLEASIQIIKENADSPDAQIGLSKVTNLQCVINYAVINQANLQDIKTAIKINIENG